ncbi:MAG: DUF4062 domain-containing protein [Planctomycetes bacterium]|nr:DUF4062 domain-containing protein [Planctomycetota bacterium]
MKIFISSTCYDLIDLRAELYEDLRDLGVEAIFSDLKESGFSVPDDDMDSIETCLANLRDCQKVIVILSQRYGRPLRGKYGELSATHVEYRDALQQKIPIAFYVRDRLLGEWGCWKDQGRPDQFKTSWTQERGAIQLFKFIDEHIALHKPSESQPSKNWYWPFQTSVDLRADIRRWLAPEASRAIAEKLIRIGQVPIIFAAGQGLGLVNRQSPNPFYRFEFDLINAGPVPALSITAQIVFTRSNSFQGNDSRIAAILPGNDSATRQSRHIMFDIPKQTMETVLALPRDNQVELPCHLFIAYATPTGHTFEDRSRLVLVTRNEDIEFSTTPTYVGKSIAGEKSFLLQN